MIGGRKPSFLFIQSIMTKSKNANNKSFYLLSPDGFLLSPSSKKHTSMEDAKKEFDKWVVPYRHQEYYRTAKGERIPSDILWHRMIIHSEPFYNV